MLPRINFAISTRGTKLGVDHLGLQADSAEELVELKNRAQAADLELLDEGATTCCYARGDKHWVTDPQGIAWEHFHTLHDIPVFSQSEPAAADAQPAASACCTPPTSGVPLATSGAAVAKSVAEPGRGKPIGIAVKSASSCC